MLIYNTSGSLLDIQEFTQHPVGVSLFVAGITRGITAWAVGISFVYVVVMEKGLQPVSPTWDIPTGTHMIRIKMRLFLVQNKGNETAFRSFSFFRFNTCHKQTNQKKSMTSSFFFLVCEIKIFVVSKRESAYEHMSIRTRSHSQDVDNILKKPASLPISSLFLKIKNK